jgi:uncharacterized protein (TIGR00730 family)
MLRLCVFCGSSTGNRTIFTEKTRALGRLMADAHVGLVYGGGNVGLMGVLAHAVLQGGGEVIGVIPRSLEAKELALQDSTRLHVVDTMHERKALMAELADAFVALPGGFGTCDELFEILTWAQLSMHNKPVGLLNIDEFFTPLLSWLHSTVTAGFVKADNLRLLHVATEPSAILKLLQQPPQPAPEAKWIGREDL